MAGDAPCSTHLNLYKVRAQYRSCGSHSAWQLNAAAVDARLLRGKPDLGSGEGERQLQVHSQCPPLE